MNIYLDESYNLQKVRGKMFISINGFAVLDERRLRKKWKSIRRPYVKKTKRRVHATDSFYEPLREESIKMLGHHDVNILSVFQLSQEIPYEHYDEGGIKFDQVYSELLKNLFGKLSLGEYQKVRIVIDARKQKGGILGKKKFVAEIETYLKKNFPNTQFDFRMTPSYMDILVELADFVSNTFYKEYHSDSEHAFKKLGFRMVQIKNPL